MPQKPQFRKKLEELLNEEGIYTQNSDKCPGKIDLRGIFSILQRICPFGLHKVRRREEKGAFYRFVEIYAPHIR